MYISSFEGSLKPTPLLFCPNYLTKQYFSAKIESILNNQEIQRLGGGIMTGELDGLNRLVFDGPFKCSLSNKREVPVRNLVIVSRNGEVSNLPVNLVPGAQDAVHGVLLDLAKSQATAAGLERSLSNGGAISLGNGLFWLKSEAKIF